MKQLCLFILVFLVSLNVHAQDIISGRWQGNYVGSFFVSTPEKLVVDIKLSYDTFITGSSHLYYPNHNYEHYTIKGFYRKKDSLIYFYEDSTLGIKLGFGSQNCLGNYTMKLKIEDGLMELEGRWRTNPTSPANCAAMGVFLEKKLPPKPKPKPKHEETQTKIDVVSSQPLKKNITGPDAVKMQAPALPVKPDKNLERPTTTQSLIEVAMSERDSIKIEILDNKEIDNDAVSIYVNGEQKVKKQVLSAKPIVFYTSISRQEPISRIIMAAESMGSVPPCTALMRVTVGKKVHEVTLSSNMGNSGSLELFLKE